jgi:hypothetical protein
MTGPVCPTASPAYENVDAQRWRGMLRSTARRLPALAPGQCGTMKKDTALVVGLRAALPLHEAVGATMSFGGNTVGPESASPEGATPVSVRSCRGGADAHP